jgi:uncharacterized protein
MAFPPTASGPATRPGTGLTRLIVQHPVAVLMVWFFTVGQAIAFVPLLVPGALPTAQFVIAANLVGLVLPALVVTWVADGRAGVRDLVRRALAGRVPARWYVFALIVVPAATVVVAVVTAGPPGPLSAAAWGWTVLAGLLVQTVLGLVTSNLGEEVAWTGVVQRRLERRRGPMTAAVLTAPLFALQHASLAVANAGSGAVLLLAVLVVLAVPFRALMGWTYHRTGSLLLVGLVHAAGNASAGGSGLGDGLLTLLYPGQALGPLHLIGAAVLGLAVVVATRRRLGAPGERSSAGVPVPAQDTHGPRTFALVTTRLTPDAGIVTHPRGTQR